MKFTDLATEIKRQISSFKSNSGAKGAPNFSLDGLLGKADRKLVGIVLFSIFMVVVGFGNLLNQWSLSKQHDELSEKILTTEEEINLTAQKLTNIYKQNSLSLEQAKLAPKTSSDLLRLISESIQRSGMVVTKVSSAGSQAPDVFVIEAEGGYGGIRMLLTELRYYSASMDIKAIGITAEPTRRTLILTTTFKFVTPPKFENFTTPTPTKVSFFPLIDEVYDDGDSLLRSANRKDFKQVQFTPRPNNNDQQLTPKSPSPPQRSGNEPMAPEINPFFVPAGPAGVSTGGFPAGGAGSSVSGATRALPVRSNDGLYVTGCMASNKKSACIFQLSDGTTSIINLGGQISKNLILVRVNSDSIVIRNEGKEVRVKIGDQIR